METYQSIRTPLLDFLPLLSNPNPNQLQYPLTSPELEPEPVQDHFDRLPDPVLLLILNRVHDVKSLGRFSLLSRRFRSLIPLVDQVHVKIDCVISDNNSSSPNQIRPRGGGFLHHLSRAFQTLSHLLIPSRSRIPSSFHSGPSSSEISHHSPNEVLKIFKEVKFLNIFLPGGELGLDEGVLLKWTARFGSTLENCVIFGASHVYQQSENPNLNPDPNSEQTISNVVFKLRVVWTISALIAASARHYLLKSIISNHETLERLILKDEDGQGELIMDETQLMDFRVKPISSSSDSLRTVVPALSIKLWYAQWLSVPNGKSFEGATLMAIRPSGVEDFCEEWILGAFCENYRSAAKMLMERRIYCLEMNSF